MCKYYKVYTDLVFFCCLNQSHWARYTKWMHRMDNGKILLGHYAHRNIVQVFIMKEYIDLLIE